MESTWAGRDLPVLEAMAYAIEESDGTSWPDLKDIAESTGRSIDDVWKAALALRDDALIELHPAAGKGHWSVSAISGRARGIIGQWPDAEQFTALLLKRLQQEAAAETNPERQSELREAAAFIGGTGRNIVVEVVATTIARKIDGQL